MSKRLEMLEKLVVSSTDPFHHYARAMELRSLERFEDALAAYRDVRARFPDYVPTYLMAAQVSQELDRDDDAREWASAGIAKAEAAGDGKAASELGQLLALLS